MRKLFILLAFVLATVALPLQFSWGQVEPPSEPPYAIITMAAGGVSSGFGEWSGGFLFGGEYPVAKDGDFAFRFIYSQFNWNPESPLRILQPATLVKFNIGKGWDVWLVTGGELYMAGQNSGSAYFGGFGGSRTVLTYQNEKGNFGHFDLAGEITMTGAGDKDTGSYWQVKLGVAFNPAI